tara:strand:- start:497 stop:1030 length:534 start_codon:yes stop_codon:yes gene_type:complete
MPFYKYKCRNCDQTTEILHQWEWREEEKKKLKEAGEIEVNPPISSIYCGHPDGFDPDSDTYEGCGSTDVYRVMTAGGSFGIIGGDGASGGGFYSTNLGCYVKSTKHEDEIAHSRGLRRITDYSRDEIDRAYERSVEAARTQASDAARFAAGEKLEDIYSVDRMKKDGLLDDSIKGEN